MASSTDPAGPSDHGLLAGCPPPSVDALHTWLAARGVAVHPALDVVHDSTGLAVRATADIAMATQLLAVPKTAMLSHRTSSLPPIPPAAVPDLGVSTLHLALVLLHELRLGTASAFWGYTQILPRATPMVLALWPELGGADAAEAAVWVEGTEAERLLQERAAQGLDVAGLRAFFDAHAHYLPPTLAHPGGATFRSFLHAFALVSTRAFTIDLYHHVALVPFADLLNHAARPHTSLAADDFVCHRCGSLAACAHDAPRPAAGGDDGGGVPARLAHLSGRQRQTIAAEPDTVDMYAEQSIGAGAEVCNTYGDGLGDARLLVEWGFVAGEYDGEGATWAADEVCPLEPARAAWAALDEAALVSAVLGDGEDGGAADDDAGLFARPSPRPGALHLAPSGALSLRLFALVVAFASAVSPAAPRPTGEADLRARVVEAARELQDVAAALEAADDDGVGRADDGVGPADEPASAEAPAAPRRAASRTLSPISALAARAVLALLTGRIRALHAPELSGAELAEALEATPPDRPLLRTALAYAAGERQLLAARAVAWREIVEAAAGQVGGGR